MQLWQMGAGALAAKIRARALSCEEAVGAAVARMRAVNPALNAVTRDTGDAALATARAYDAALARGADLGPLAGVPVTIKDNVDVKGEATPNGMPALKDMIAPDDSPVVTNLRDAGAIFIGRTNTPELSLRAFTDNPLFGLTKNPWDAKLNCGGSSGGAGSAVAAGIGALAHGNDIGGSLRYPAYNCGVATIRPTMGRVPAFLPSAMAERPPAALLMSVQGPIARNVTDVRLGLEVMAKGDPRDPMYVPAPMRGPEPKRPVRVALSFASPTPRPLHPAVRAALETAAAQLRDAGYAVEEATPPDLQRVPYLWIELMLTEIELLQRAVVTQMASKDFLTWLDALYRAGKVLDHAGYMKGLMERIAILRRWQLFFEDYPLLLSPLSLDPPFPVNHDIASPETSQAVIDSLGYSVAMNLLGLPAGIVPVSLHEGAPIGVQLTATRFREDLCLDAMQAIEDRSGVLVERLWARG